MAAQSTRGVEEEEQMRADIAGDSPRRACGDARKRGEILAVALLVIATMEPGRASAAGGYSHHPVKFDCAPKSRFGRFLVRISNACPKSPRYGTAKPAADGVRR